MTKPRDIFVAVPAHNHQITVPLYAATVQSVIELAAGGMSMSLFCWSGDSLLPHARNLILAEFLASDSEDMVFIDSDVAWEPGGLRRLVEHPVDFVAGVYPKKKDPEQYPVNYMDKPTLQADPETRLLELGDVPFGFVRLSRKCVEMMTEANKDFPYRHSNAPNRQCYKIFDYEYQKEPDWEQGLWFGEDYVFCHKWRDLGGKVWSDPEIQLTHTGMKDFVGRFGDWLRERHKTLSGMAGPAREVLRALDDAGVRIAAE